MLISSDKGYFSVSNTLINSATINCIHQTERPSMKYFSTIFLLISGMLLHTITSHAMPMNPTDLNVEIAKALLQWNSKNLISSADLKKSELNRFFAQDFMVDANGIKNKANHDNYFQFLNTFREHIKTINYECEDFIIDSTHVVIPLKAHIQLNNGTKQVYDAILILQFNKDHKIILWREVYVLLKL